MVTIEQLQHYSKSADLIYHYTKLPVAIEFVLDNREIRFNSLKNTNDPLEFEQFYTSVGSAPSSPRDDVDRVLWEGVRLVDIVKKVCKVCCFSSDATPRTEDYDGSHLFSKGYCLPRMWSQYGDNHFGACVVLSRQKLTRHISNSTDAFELPQGEEFSIFAKEIKYDNSVPGLREALSLEYEQVKNKSAETLLGENLDPLLFTKFRNYEHEQEYRVVLHSQHFAKSEYVNVGIGDSIEGLIVGSRFKSLYLPTIRRLATRANIPIFQLTWFNGQPELRVVNDA